MAVDFISKLLENLVFLSDIAIVLFVLIFIFEKISGKSFEFFKSLKNYSRKNSVILGFIVALIATLGSLFYSEIMGFEPCKLCWFQRIFMYSLAVILLFAVMRKEKSLKKYALPLIVFGGIISVYHNFVLYWNINTACGISGVVSCLAGYTNGYGYITIPIMALTAFVLLFIIFIIKE